MALIQKSSWGKSNNPVLINQLICFKFGLYKTRATPRKLFWMTGILIKHGLLSCDIFDKLTPKRSEIPKQYREFTKNLKGVSRFKRKVMVGELAPEGRRDQKNNAAAVVEEVDNVQVVEALKLNQKAGLIEVLLALGDEQSVSNLLAAYPILTEMFEGISFNLCRILKVKLESIHLQSIPWITFICPKETSSNSLQPPERTLSTKGIESVSLGKKTKGSKGF